MRELTLIPRGCQFSVLLAVIAAMGQHLGVSEAELSTRESRAHIPTADDTQALEVRYLACCISTVQGWKRVLLFMPHIYKCYPEPMGMRGGIERRAGVWREGLAAKRAL